MTINQKKIKIMNIKKKTTTVLKPEILQRLKELNHETIGTMADRLGITPQIVRLHIAQSTKSTTKHEFMQEVRRVLKLKASEEITMAVTLTTTQTTEPA